MNSESDRQRKVEQQKEVAMESCRRQASAHNVLKVLGVAVAVMTAIGVVTQWQDIRRYVRMVRM